MHTVRSYPLPSAVLLLLAIACHEPSRPLGPAALTRVAGEGQVSYANRILKDSLRVRVTDEAGAPVAGVPIAWSTTDGTVSPLQVSTNAAGEVAATWTLPPVIGLLHATAAVGGLPPVTFTADVRPGLAITSFAITPAAISVASSPGIVVVRMKATDGFLGLSDVSVRFQAPLGGTPTGSSKLLLIAGTYTDGTWEGSVVIPQGAGAGVWTVYTLSLIRPDLSGTVFAPDGLQLQGFPYQVTVTN